MKDTTGRCNSKLDTTITGIGELDSSKEMSQIGMGNKRGRLKIMEHSVRRFKWSS